MTNNLTKSRGTYWFHGTQARMSVLLILTTTLIFAGFMALYFLTTRSEMNPKLK